MNPGISHPRLLKDGFPGAPVLSALDRPPCRVANTRSRRSHHQPASGICLHGRCNLPGSHACNTCDPSLRTPAGMTEGAGAACSPGYRLFRCHCSPQARGAVSHSRRNAQDAPGLVAGQRLDLVRSRRRSIYQCRHVPRYPATSHCDLQGTGRDAMDLKDRAWRQSAAQHHGISHVQMLRRANQWERQALELSEERSKLSALR